MGKQTGMKLREATESDFVYIMDCFTGADGGISFWKLRLLMENLDKKASEGDMLAQHLINNVHAFARLIKTAEKLF